MAAKTVIIIGSGIGGLVAGNLLAKKGHNVTIFESHSSPGGYTAGFYRNGFYFESGTLAFEASASVFKAMTDLGVLDQIAFSKEKIRWLTSAKTANMAGRIDVIPEKYDDFKKMLYNTFPSEKSNLDRYFAEVDKVYEASSATENMVIPFLYSGLKMFFSLISYLFRSRKMIKIMNRLSDMTVGEFNGQYFEKDSKVCKLMSSLMYPDMAAWMLGSVMGMYDDYWTVSKGMQSWADALADSFKKLGGQLKLNSYVDKIITSDGVVAGVSCKDVTYKADYVIAASDYKKTYLNLIDNKSLIPAKMLEKISQAAVSEPVFTVYLGLNMPGSELQKYMKIHHLVYLNLDSKPDVNNPNDENYFENSSVLLYSPSMRNPALAPQGKSSLMLSAMCPIGWMNKWGAGDKQKYKQLKEKAKQALIKKAQEVVPDLSKYIEFQDAATPLTYERFTHNSDGATSAWSWNPKKKFFPKIMSVNIDTPVRNLYIGSCWTSQMGGVPGALMAAYVCVKKIK